MFSIGKFSKLIGVTTQTLRNWHSSGELIPVKITKGKTRYYSIEQLNEYKGINSKSRRENYIYSRVPNRNQIDDLKNQINFIKTYCNCHGIITNELSDIGSGQNYKRKNWNILLDLVLADKVDKIIVTHKDRFIRFGFEWFESLCKKHNTEIIVINNESLSPQHEMIQDLISIIHVEFMALENIKRT